MEIYSSYDQEPEDIYEPLDEKRYAEFYSLEMAEFTKDIEFYSSLLGSSKQILESGCGTGRIAHRLSAVNYPVTGVDISLSMLAIAQKKKSAARFVCMDMRNLSFITYFDTIIIPYNTLNLLATPFAIRQCLQSCRNLLTPDGQLLLHLYVMQPEDIHSYNPSFQFQMFDRPQGGKLIKEIIKNFHKSEQLLEMTERYKVRPLNNREPNSNYAHTVKLFGADQHHWTQLLNQAGFTIKNLATEYDGSFNSSSSHGRLLVCCT